MHYSITGRLDFVGDTSVGCWNSSNPNGWCDAIVELHVCESSVPSSPPSPNTHEVDCFFLNRGVGKLELRAWEPWCVSWRNQNIFSKCFIVCASCRGKPFHQSLPAARVEDFGCNSVQDALYYPHGSLFTYMSYIRSRGVVCTQHGARLSLYNHQHYRMQCVPGLARLLEGTECR